MQNIFDSGVDSALILGRTVPVYNEQTAGANKGSWCMGLMAPSTRFRTFLKLHSSHSSVVVAKQLELGDGLD